MNEIPIIVPRIGTNDDYVTIGTWLVKYGDYVKKGQEIVSLETTKETEEVQAECDGYIFYDFENGTELKVGDQLAVITDNANYKFKSKKIDNEEIDNITNKARILAEKYHVDLSLLKEKNIIKEKDVLSLIHVTDHEIKRSKANDLIIITGGGLSKMCIDLILQNKAYNIHGITDSVKDAGTLIDGIPVLGDMSLLPELRKEGYETAINSYGSIIADNHSELFQTRKTLFEMAKSYGFFLPTLIHPTASIAVSAQLGEGVLVFEHATVGSDAIIGDDCIINTGVIVSHDCKIGAHTRISPGAILAGNVTVGENALIGMGVTVYMGVKIGTNAVIANGKTIFNDIPAGEVVK